MGEPLAVVADVANAWRDLSNEEEAQARHLLVLASQLLRSEVSGLDDRLAAGTLDADLVRHVVASMVIRGLRNPDGARQRSETVGPFTQSASYTDMVSQLSVLPYERRLLTPATGRVSGLGTIRVTPGLAPPAGPPHALPSGWWGW